MDDAEKVRRDEERIERLYGFGSESATEKAKRARSIDAATPPLANSDSQSAAADRARRMEASLSAISSNYRAESLAPSQRSTSMIGAGYVPVARESRLGWGDVFDLAFKFTVALAVINLPIAVVLYLVLRSAE